MAELGRETRAAAEAKLGLSMSASSMVARNEGEGRRTLDFGGTLYPGGDF